MNTINKNFLFQDVSSISGIGKKISTYLKKKKLKKLMIYFGTYLIHIQIGLKQLH